jgi:ABC-type transporter Mla subunit MlaD
MRMKKGIGKIETSLANTQKQSQDNYDNVQRLTVVVKENSVAIDKLKLTTAGLSHRMDILETMVDSIISTIDALADNVQDMLKTVSSC